MADPHEEQLLNELLLDMRGADEHAGAARLEQRVMAAWDAHHERQTTFAKATMVQACGNRRYVVIAGGVAAALLMAVAGSMLKVLEAPPPRVHQPPRVVASANSPIAIPAELPQVGELVRLTPGPTKSQVGRSRIAQSRIAQSPIAQSPMEFVPLMPLTPHELSGPFQIVRVQMPRASLGAMAPPFAYPEQFVEADVLLGEDGMARAIRVSTNRSVNPRRSR
jgi:hypothetical protein